jgi:hypothetical protein
MGEMLASCVFCIHVRCAMLLYGVLRYAVYALVV